MMTSLTSYPLATNDSPAMTSKDGSTVEDMIRKELQLLLNYEEIKKSQTLARFLQFVVEKKLSGQEDEIKEYTIGTQGLGKPNDFNPQLDSSVRIHAGRLRKVLQQYYAGPGKEDAIVIDIPKGSYIPVFRDGAETNKIDGIAPQKLTDNFDNKPVATVNGQHKPALAVLPFHNLSSDDSKDYFVKGIGEQLSTDLARFQNISVISYYGTDAYDPALRDLQEMKKTSNVDYVLTGSVRIINELVRLNVQLILSGNGQIIFTETYSKHLTPENIFEIQEEVTGEILNAIADEHGIIVMNKAHASPFTETENLNVQEAIYKYFDYTSDFDPEKFDSTIYSMEKAVVAEPNNALASALLSCLYLFTYCTKRDQNDWLLQKASELAQSAVRLDAHCQHAQKAMAWVLLLTGKKEKSLETIELCIKLNAKSSGVMSFMALAYICLGQFEKGYHCLLETLRLNPFPSASSKYAFCLYFFHKTDYEESLNWLKRLSPIDTALFSLIRISLQGKIANKKFDIGDKLMNLKDNAPLLVGRTILDPVLQSEILDGLKLAGLLNK